MTHFTPCNIQQLVKQQPTTLSAKAENIHKKANCIYLVHRLTEQNTISPACMEDQCMIPVCPMYAPGHCLLALPAAAHPHHSHAPTCPEVPPNQHDDVLAKGAYHTTSVPCPANHKSMHMSAERETERENYLHTSAYPYCLRHSSCTIHSTTMMEVATAAYVI